MQDPGGTRESCSADVSADALLAAVLEIVDDAVISCDDRGAITSWNHAANRCFGYAASEVLGSASSRLFPGHLRDEIQSVFEVATSGGRVDHVETEILRKDGMPMPVSISACSVTVGSVSPTTVLVVRDVTEQALAQATLAELELRVRESEALAKVGSWLWDLRSGVVQWSDEFYRIHGVDPLIFDGTLDGHFAAIHADDRDRIRAAIASSVASARPFEGRYRIVRPGGEVRHLHARAHPTIGSDGTVLGLRGIAQDVTDRRFESVPTD
jgi:PAS domain S-box-containing protein